MLGKNAAPITLSITEQLFAYVKWPGYIGVTRSAAGIDTDWPARYTALRKLSHVTDPDAFADASAHTAFGSIDVFILKRSRPSRWSWRAFDTLEPVIIFTRAQVSPHAFAAFKLPGNYELVVRRPQTNS